MIDNRAAEYHAARAWEIRKSPFDMFKNRLIHGFDPDLKGFVKQFTVNVLIPRVPFYWYRNLPRRVAFHQLGYVQCQYDAANAFTSPSSVCDVPSILLYPDDIVLVHHQPEDLRHAHGRTPLLDLWPPCDVGNVLLFRKLDDDTPTLGVGSRSMLGSEEDSGDGRQHFDFDVVAKESEAEERPIPTTAAIDALVSLIFDDNDPAGCPCVCELTRTLVDAGDRDADGRGGGEESAESTLRLHRWKRAPAEGSQPCACVDCGGGGGCKIQVSPPATRCRSCQRREGEGEVPVPSRSGDNNESGSGAAARDGARAAGLAVPRTR